MTTNGVPGVTEIVVGDTVTPVGKPFTATAIVPLKPAIAVLLSVTCPLAPGISPSVPGVAVSAKSAFDGPVPAVTVNATETLVLRVPDAPYTFTVVVPSAASAAAVTVNVVLEPTFTVVVAGETVTPVGSPLTETCTDPVKLFALLGVTVMLLALSLSDRHCGVGTERKGAAVGRPPPPLDGGAAAGNQRNQTQTQKAEKGKSRVTHAAPDAGTLLFLHTAYGGPFAASS